MNSLHDPGAHSPFKLAVLVPLYNDWQNAERLIQQLSAAFKNQDVHLHILLVDDGSIQKPDLSVPRDGEVIHRVEILSLCRNVGHQRAIAVGLCHIHKHFRVDAVTVMDADGEDNPSDAVRLLKRHREKDAHPVVFAERSKRSEGLGFRVFYFLYRQLHCLLTGHKVRFGNFSILPASVLERIVTNPDLWNHYVGCILRIPQPFVVVPTQRGTRYFGASHMNLASLILHGLGSISVFAETVGVRLLLAAIVVGFMILLALGGVILIRLTTDLAIPGWATYVCGIALVLLFQTAIAAFLIMLALLNMRNNVNIGPLATHQIFIRNSELFYEKK